MIKAALFDLDGTLLDSHGVWQEVDRIFFERCGIEMPEDYPRSIAGMSYLTTAEYTKNRFALTQTPAEIADEWTSLSRNEYINNVLVKSGAAELTGTLKDMGIRMCVVTTNLIDVVTPCLIRNGIYDMFEFIMTTDQTGGGSKREGRLYRAAAEKMGVDHSECAVFEDVCEGIEGAKALGMQAYCVIDEFFTNNIEHIKSIADGWADNPGDLIKYFK